MPLETKTEVRDKAFRKAKNLVDITFHCPKMGHEPSASLMLRPKPFMCPVLGTTESEERKFSVEKKNRKVFWWPFSRGQCVFHH